MEKEKRIKEVLDFLEQITDSDEENQDALASRHQ